jgi:hypothetical protein
MNHLAYMDTFCCIVMYENKCYDKKMYPKLVLNKLKIMGGPNLVYIPLVGT